MSQTRARRQQLRQLGGYVCAPYTHDHGSVDIKEEWHGSKNIGSMYFVTATFSDEGRSYLSSTANHYVLAEFRDGARMMRDLERHRQAGSSFMFSVDEDLFMREAAARMNFVSVYYLEYNESDEDVGEVALAVARRDKVGRAGIGRMDVCSTVPQRFTFPYRDHIVVLEVSSDKNHQSVNKYCEKTRRDVCRKGITMTNLVSFSILESLK